jgi:hypothetical protein
VVDVAAVEAVNAVEEAADEVDGPSLEFPFEPGKKTTA